MRHKTLACILVCFLPIAGFNQSVGIGTETPHESAVLDISSTSGGLLIPCMNTVQRDAIADPADGLIVYDTESSSLWWYSSDATNWIEISDGLIKLLRDDDGDTQIQVEESNNENIIRFDMAGTEYFRMDGGRLEFVNSAGSVFIGEEAGANNSSGSANTAVGYKALNKNTTGNNNTVIGFESMRENIDGNANTSIGTQSLNQNTSGFNNTAVGFASLNLNVNGFFNSATGANALESNLSGSYNTANGAGSLLNNTIGHDNTAIGFESMRENIDGNFNTATGLRALALNQSGSFNTANGVGSLYNNTTGFQNTSIGFEASRNNDTGMSNTSVGYRALFSNSDGIQNVAIGSESMYSALGDANTAIGFRALYSNASNHNTAIGFGSLRNNSSGYNNSANGALALYSNSIGTENTASGSFALYSNISGHQNTALGHDAGASSNGSGNIYIGYKAGGNANSSNSLYIENSNADSTGALIYGEFDTDILAFNAEVGVGTTTPTTKLDVNGQIRMRTDAAADAVLVGDSDGVMTWTSPNDLARTVLKDDDNDTKIQVEENSDEDIIRFDLGGTEFFRMDNGRLEVLSTNQSVYVGEGAGETADETSNDNVFVGYHAGQSNSSGEYNSATGSQALYSNTFGDYNTAYGSQALYSNTNGYDNTGNGALVLRSNTTGNNNTAHGVKALYSNTTGYRNVAIGARAMIENTTGNFNTVVGGTAGFLLTSGSSNIFLGFSAGAQETGSHKLYIENSSAGPTGALIYGEFDNDWLRINGRLSPMEGITDIDGDTKIQVEETIDEDIIRFDIDGVERATLDEDRLYLQTKIGLGTSTPNSTLHLNGSISSAVLTTSSSISLDDTHQVILFNGSDLQTGPISLPEAGPLAGRIYTIKRIGSGNPQINAHFNDLIENNASFILNDDVSSITIISDGDNWWIIAKG